MRKTLILSTAVAAGALILAPAAAAAMPAGDYDFNLPGLQSIPVHVEETGFETIKLTTPNGFKVDMAVNRRGTGTRAWRPTRTGPCAAASRCWPTCSTASAPTA